MSVLNLRRPDISRLVMVLAAVTVVASVWAAHDDLQVLRGPAVTYVVLFFLAIALGEVGRLTSLTGRHTAPMSSAAALGFGLSSMAPAGSPPVGAGIVVATISLAMVVGWGASVLSGRAGGWLDTSARIVGSAIAPILYRHVEIDGHTLLAREEMWGERRWLVALMMLAVGGVAMLVELAIEGAIRAGRDHSPLLRTILDEARSAAGLATALVASGALIALAESALGFVALPLFLFPLMLTYFAVQRYASVRATYRQTITALSSLTTRAGYTRQDHADRVAELSLAIGRDLGLGQRELTDLEYAALLHDLGQVALREPIPRGATVMAAPADQQRIAHDGAEIVRTTGVLDNVARILEAQTTPYRQVREFGEDLPMPSRIIKVANAYDDLYGVSGADDDRAMERIHLGLGYEYDPRVVDSLTKVLERQRRAASTS
jgi:hypothetical protein